MGKRKYYEEKIRRLERKLRKISRSPKRSRSRRRSTSSSTASPRRVLTPHYDARERTPTSPPIQVRSPSPIAQHATDYGPSTSGANIDQAQINADEVEIPPEYMLALGEEGAEKEEVGDPLQSELALRWTRLIQSGLGKEARDTLHRKYLTPSNFERSMAPKLNPEMKAVMSEISLKRDTRITHRQHLTGKLLCCLGKSLTKILKGQINTKEIIEEINDGAKIAAEIFFQDSSSRKFFALAGVSKNIRESLKDVKTDEFLFSTDCADNIKSAQAVKKTGDILKNTDSTAIKKKTSTKPGNWKGPLRQHRQQYQQHRVRSGPRPQQTTHKINRREWKQHTRSKYRH